MFRTITEEPPARIGKIFSKASYYGKSTTYAPGRGDWQCAFDTHQDRNYTVSITFSRLK